MVFKSAGPAQEPSAPLSFEQIVGWRRPSDPQVSPDGKIIAFSLKPVSNDEEHPKASIWVVPYEDGAARPLTGGNGLDDSPRFSPDGTRLAFLSDRSERGKASVYVMPVDGGEGVRVFDQQGELADLTWSPDGRFLAVLLTEPETEEEKKRKEERDDVHVWDSDYKYRRLWVIDTAKGTSRAISPERRQVHVYCWSTDSQRLAINTSLTPRVDDIFGVTDVSIIGLDDADTKPVFSPRSIAADLVWSNDGRALAYRGPAGRVVNDDYVYSISTDGGDPICLTPGYEGTIDHLGLAASGDLYFSAFEGLNAVIYRLDWSGTRTRLSPVGFDGKITPPISLSGDGRRLAIVREDARHAPNVWAITLDDISPGAPNQRTTFSRDLELSALGEAEIVHWTSDPGVEIEGLLIRPSGYVPGERYPLVALVHGGPTWHWSNMFHATWHDWGQMLAGRGYAVLLPNPRGSTGRGPGFSNAIFGDIGGGEFRDLMSGIDAMIERGIADPQRLGVGGWSWGGYMTAWTVSQTNRFKAAVMGAGLPNMVSDNGLGDIPSANLSYFETTPYHDPEPYWERSAIRYIRHATTPTLILHGEADERVHPAQGREMYIALRTLGVQTQFVTYPREGHRIVERKHQLDLVERVVAWYDRFLRPGSA